MSYKSNSTANYRSVNGYTGWDNPSGSGSRITNATKYLVKKEVYSNVSYSSPRINGKLQLKTNPHSFRSERTIASNTSYKSTTDSYWYIPTLSGKYITWRITNRANDTSIREPAVSSPSQQKASLAFYNDVANLKVSLGVAFAERRQTVNLVSSRAKQIARAALLVRKGKLKSAWSALGHPNRRAPTRHKKFSSQWLEYQYGWVPLYNDIYGAMLTTIKRPPTAPYKITRGFTDSGEVYDSNTDGTTRWRYKDLVTVKGFVSVTDPGAVTENELGLRNPALIGWELIPFSFVADWFIPVGAWLQAQTALVGVNILDPSITTTVWRTSDFRFDGKKLKSNFRDTYEIQQYGYCRRRTKTKNRSLSVPSKPSLVLHNGMNFKRAIDAVALVSQRLRG